MQAPDPMVMTRGEREAARIVRVRAILGMEIHVELSTRRKVFASAPSPAHPDFAGAGANELTDAVVLALPGALPVVNARALELAASVGVAMGCRIAEVTRFDRKSYAYPDLPKGYQISQLDLPICFDGLACVPMLDARGKATGDVLTVPIVRAHLEEDAGKLLHELPAELAAISVSGSGRLGGSIVDLNRAGASLLEIVTAPTLGSADECVAMARGVRSIVRALGASEAVLEAGHIRFEPNINTELTFESGRTVRTPIVEVKNLNSFKALRGAIEHELREQPERWRATGEVFAPGTKSTRGWDDELGATVAQREKEEADDYRYFPDPDLMPIRLGETWASGVSASLPELPCARFERLCSSLALEPEAALALSEEPTIAALFDGALETALAQGASGRESAARAVANLLLQSGARLANERKAELGALGLSAEAMGELASMRERGEISAQSADQIMTRLADGEHAPRAIAEREGMLIVRDTAQLEAWVSAAIEAEPQAAAEFASGNDKASGRLIAAAMRASAGAADAKTVRELLAHRLR